MKVFHFGSWSFSGHYIRTPGGGGARMAGPWSPRDLDTDGFDPRGRVTGGGFCPPDPEQPQGVWRLTRAPGWTAIGCWDRTGDCTHRKGSRSVFVAEGEHSEAEMLEIAAQHFPKVWARIQGEKS